MLFHYILRENFYLKSLVVVLPAEKSFCSEAEVSFRSYSGAQSLRTAGFSTITLMLPNASSGLLLRSHSTPSSVLHGMQKYAEIQRFKLSLFYRGRLLTK